MRHRRQGKQLSRTASHRRAMLRNMVTSLFEHERITTTVPKARECRRVAERLITKAKKGDLNSRRLVAAYVRDDAVVRKLFDTIAPWYAERPGGYTRILKVGYRKGDGGETGILELVKTGEVLEAHQEAMAERARKRDERRETRRREAAEAAAAAAGGAGMPMDDDDDDDEDEDKK